MIEASEAYVTGLLSEVEPLVRRLEADLGAARARATRIDAELSTLLVRAEQARGALAAHARAAGEAVAAVAAHDARVGGLHRELAALAGRAEELEREMARAGQGAVHVRLRRERAKVLVQIEDRQNEVASVATAIERARAARAAADLGIATEKDRGRALLSELDALQGQLPGPRLYLELFEARAARAHCRWFLDHRPEPWAAELRAGIAVISELHRDLRAGKYRLDRHGDVLGGRATASAEALYAAAALGDAGLVRELFSSIADPTLLLDHLQNPFRVWCLGLYAEGDSAALARLLGKHRSSRGLRGGYVEAFSGLLARDPRRVSAGIKTVARHEWAASQAPKLVRGAGVVSLGATALARLAADVGLAVALPGPTVPEGLLTALRSARAAVALGPGELRPGSAT